MCGKPAGRNRGYSRSLRRNSATSQESSSSVFSATSRTGTTSSGSPKARKRASTTTSHARSTSCAVNVQRSVRRCSSKASTRSGSHAKRAYSRARWNGGRMQHAVTDELKKSTGTTWTIYGQSGVGKTPLASCFPHPWIWDCEAGAKSALVDGIPVTKVETYTDIMALVTLAQSAKPGRIKLGEHAYPWCTLVVDTLGE